MVIGRVPKPYRPCLRQRRSNYTRASSTPINCNATVPPLPAGAGDDPLAQVAAPSSGGARDRRGAQDGVAPGSAQSGRSEDAKKEEQKLDNGGSDKIQGI